MIESYVVRTRDKAAALVFMKKALKRDGSPEAITIDGLCSYGATMDELGCRDKQKMGRWAKNRAGNSHLPFRQRERAMLRSRQTKRLRKFASVHANVHNRFSLERHLIDRQAYRERRSAVAGAGWLGPVFKDRHASCGKAILVRLTPLSNELATQFRLRGRKPIAPCHSGAF